MNENKNQLKDGKRHGYWEEYDENSSIIKGNYIDGKAEGLAEAFYANGQLKYKFYSKNGKIEGLVLIYYRDGTLWKKKNIWFFS